MCPGVGLATAPVGGQIEKIYIDVEEEKTYDEYIDVEATNESSETLDISNFDSTNIRVVETIDEISCSENPTNVTTDNSDTDNENSTDSSYELVKELIDVTPVRSPLNDLELFKAEDLFNDFDSILDCYNSYSNVSSDANSSSSTDAEVNVDEEWGGLLSDLFPSLSSL